MEALREKAGAKSQERASTEDRIFYVRFDRRRAGEVEAKQGELGLRTYQELFTRLWDSAGPALRRDGSVGLEALLARLPVDLRRQVEAAIGTS